MFLGVDWGAFVVVFATALAATAVIVTSFALGIRLFADGAVESDGGSGVVAAGAGASAGASASRSRPLAATVAGGLCFAVGTAAVLFGLWMIVPQFH
ncbi:MULTISPECIES: hypothetical protein [unclassified Frigoribacterium]|uniref:hypothetical protein n=1 Tax=unclassified Frigoribacterium TaxID=2627005 RepID=UPI0005BD2D31|nr:MULTISPECIES: hypothetical protein [unclassified Frigoribacterium]MBD8539722.1 hypothetical protein [Frigoribacterium sp. CFBP 8751]